MARRLALEISSEGFVLGKSDASDVRICTPMTRCLGRRRCTTADGPINRPTPRPRSPTDPILSGKRATSPLQRLWGLGGAGAAGGSPGRRGKREGEGEAFPRGEGGSQGEGGGGRLHRERGRGKGGGGTEEPAHLLWPQNPFWTHSFMRRMNTKVTFLQAPACPSVLSRLGRVLPVGCDDLESMDCTETALQPA